MRNAIILTALAALVLPSPAPAQLRVPTIIQRVIPATRDKAHQTPQLVGIDALRADFLARTGSDAVYFGGDSSLLSAPAKTTLAAQAQWLLQHPEVVVRIEGHTDP